MYVRNNDKFVLINIHFITTVNVVVEINIFLVNRFERPPQQINQSKQALSNMLRSRHPINTFIPGMQTNPNSVQQPSNYGQMQRGFPRQAIRQPHPNAMQPNQVSILIFKMAY